MNARTTAVLLVLALATVAAPAAASAQPASGEVIGWPRLSVETSTPELSPGTESTLALTVVNDPRLESGGPAQYERQVTTARGATLAVDDGGVPFDVREERIAVGDVPQGARDVAPVSVTVPEGTPPGTYTLPVTVRYSETRLVEYGPHDVEYASYERRETKQVTVRVRQRARFDVVSTSSTAQVGDTGTVEVAIENVGTAPASAARVTFSAATGDVRVGVGSANASSAFVGEWAPGEVKTANVTVAVDSDAQHPDYALDARVGYEDADGIPRTSRALTASLRPAAEQTFSLRDFRADLRVDRNGTVRGTVVNTGPTRVRHPVLVFRSETGDLRPRPAVVALSALEPGETASFAYDVSVPPNATESVQQVSLTVRYRNQRGDVRESDPLERSVRIRPERDRFSVTPVAATFEIDTDNRLTVRVANADATPLSEITARLSVQSPFESESSTAYAARLAPGESAVLAFEVTVVDDAVETTAPVSLSLTAERPNGETVRAGPYPVPITIREPPGPNDVTVLVLGVVVVFLLLGAGWWWLRR
ncbi:MAG: COG1361 S-layer family protein [Haloferacaceae archaeon]